MQALLREQPRNIRSINIYDILAEYLTELVLGLDLELPGEGISSSENENVKRFSYAYDVSTYIFRTLREAAEGT